MCSFHCMFLFQGVNLANIVKDLSLQEGGAKNKHASVECIENLEQELVAESPDIGKFKENLAKLKAECDIDLAHRCLAGKNNAYPVLYNLMDKYQADADLLGCILATYCALCNGNPDLLTPQGLSLFMSVLKEQKEHMSNTAATIRLIRHTCLKHEPNRQQYVKAGIIPALMSALESFKTDSANVVKEVCATLRVLTLDDDMRVPFGKAHDHAKMIVTEADALKKILEICGDYSEDTGVLGELFLTLARLAVRNEFCQEIMDLGGLELMLGAIEKNTSNQVKEQYLKCDRSDSVCNSIHQIAEIIYLV